MRRVRRCVSSAGLEAPQRPPGPLVRPHDSLCGPAFPLPPASQLMSVLAFAIVLLTATTPEPPRAGDADDAIEIPLKRVKALAIANKPKPVEAKPGTLRGGFLLNARRPLGIEP